MNKFIKEQLEKIHVPMSDWQEDSETIIFYNDSLINNKLEINGIYKIKITDLMINNTEFHKQWNPLSFPSSDTFIIKVLKILSNLVEVSAIENANTEQEKVYSSIWLMLSEIIILGQYV